jgi:hypothetical protein
MAIKGNYWLDLIAKEKKLHAEIESAVDSLVGNKFFDYNEMAMSVKDAITRRIENYGIKHHMGIFHLEYDLDLKYDNAHRLTGFVIKFVMLDEDVW